MYRPSLIFALLALLAAALFAAPANAHGSGQHGMRSAAVVESSAVARTEANAGFLASPNTAGAWLPDTIVQFAVADGSLQPVDSGCPETNDGCCSAQCCVGKDLVLDKLDVGPVLVSETVALLGTRPPSDATPQTQLRPPCR